MPSCRRASKIRRVQAPLDYRRRGRDARTHRLFVSPAPVLYGEGLANVLDLILCYAIVAIVAVLVFVACSARRVRARAMSLSEASKAAGASSSSAVCRPVALLLSVGGHARSVAREDGARCPRGHDRRTRHRLSRVSGQKICCVRPISCPRRTSSASCPWHCPPSSSASARPRREHDGRNSRARIARRASRALATGDPGGALDPARRGLARRRRAYRHRDVSPASLGGSDTRANRSWPR